MEKSAMDRRAVLKSLATAAVAGALPSSLAQALPAVASNSINPRWYGFNLLEYFSTDPDWMKYFPYKNNGNFKEDDFRWIGDWGFNWVRLPMDYRFWTDANDPMKIDEKKVEPIDRAIRLGQKYRIHVNISLHRAPGECILDGADEKRTGIHVTQEKTSVYTDQPTLDAFVHQWTYFAKRYQGISNRDLSFNLVNEPLERGTPLAKGEKDYVRVAKAAIAAIRSIDSQRLIVTDGYPVATQPIPGLFDTGILQSAHDYVPGQVTGYKNPWITHWSNVQLPVPTWPLKDAKGNIVCDKQMLEAKFQPWGELAKYGIPIHFGELGCSGHTPADVAYRWYSDTLDMIDGLHSGWALWNFRGRSGILDTKRPGAHFKEWHGHQLDVTLLNILRSKMHAV
jgi:endoglucanase